LDQFRHDQVTGRFVQSKRIPALRGPLQSSGRFILSRANGLAWLTEQPFAAVLLVNRERLLRYTPGETGSMSRVPLTGIAADLPKALLSLLAGDHRVLQQRFVADFAIRNGRCHVLLAPKPGPAARDAALPIKQIDVRTGRYIESIEILETGGTQTHIELLDPSFPETLTVDDKNLFH